jgi:hypothetical protein
VKEISDSFDALVLPVLELRGKPYVDYTLEDVLLIGNTLHCYNLTCNRKNEEDKRVPMTAVVQNIFTVAMELKTQTQVKKETNENEPFFEAVFHKIVRGLRYFITAVHSDRTVSGFWHRVSPSDAVMLSKKPFAFGLMVKEKNDYDEDARYKYAMEHLYNYVFLVAMCDHKFTTWFFRDLNIYSRDIFEIRDILRSIIQDQGDPRRYNYPKIAQIADNIPDKLTFGNPKLSEYKARALFYFVRNSSGKEDPKTMSCAKKIHEYAEHFTGHRYETNDFVTVEKEDGKGSMLGQVMNVIGNHHDYVRVLVRKDNNKTEEMVLELDSVRPLLVEGTEAYLTDDAGKVTEVKVIGYVFDTFPPTYRVTNSIDGTISTVQYTMVHEKRRKKKRTTR